MQKYNTNIYNYAQKGLANGVNICRNSVDYTLGGKGKYAIIRQEFYPYYIQTKDAYSIIQSIKCEDPLERQAVDMMKDATDSMNKRSKDGRTTMCILTDEILQKSIESTKNPLEIEKELVDSIDTIEKLIDEQTVQIDIDKIESVATTASDSERIGKLIAEIYKNAGKECIINHIEASGTLEDYIVYTNGVHFQDAGLLSPFMVHDEEAKKENRAEKKAIYFNPSILITKRKIVKDDDIAPLIDTLVRHGKKDLVILAEDIDANIVTTLVNTHKAGLINICIIRPPMIWKNYIFEDFAKVTGATILGDESGVTFKNLSLEHLGTCGKIIVDKEETIITGIQDISEHIEDLKQRGDEDSKLRLWWLNTRTATIRMGAHNEGELSLLRLKAEDAIHSSQLALNSGIVAGGGVALLKISNQIDSPILREALSAPFRQIIKNAGINQPEIEIDGKTGINAKNGEIVDMFDANIIDASMVVKNAVRNAIAIASRILTSEILIDLPKKTPEEIQIELLQAKRMPY